MEIIIPTEYKIPKIFFTLLELNLLIIKDIPTIRNKKLLIGDIFPIKTLLNGIDFTNKIFSKLKG